MFSLKLCCLLAVILACTNAGLSPEQIEAFQTVMNDCKTKTGATDDDIGTIMKHEIPETDTGLCFAACAKKSLGITKDDNTLNITKIEQLLAPIKDEDSGKYSDIMKVVNACALSVAIEGNECQASKKVMECFKEQVEANQLKIDFLSMLK